MRVYLKIKIKSLAAEATIIRQETRKYPGDSPVRFGLYQHRVYDVRQEARAAILAYGFLRGRSYARMEPFTYSGPNWKRIEELVKKYGEDDPRERLQRFAAWKDQAVEHIKSDRKLAA